MKTNRSKQYGLAIDLFDILRRFELTTRDTMWMIQCASIMNKYVSDYGQN